MKPTQSKNAADAAGRVLALIAAADGQLDARKLQALEAHHAFERLGLPRARFLRFARDCLREVDGSAEEYSWLRTEELAYIDPLLDAVPGAPERLLICRLAAAAMAADDAVSEGERLVYDYVLARWHVDRDAVAEELAGPAAAPLRPDA